MTFNEALKKINTAEGRWTNDPRDHGGMTACGIARNFNPKAAIWPYIDNLMAKGNTLAQVERIARGDPFFMNMVDAFYRGKYWNACRCDELPNLLRYPVFSAAVNIGVAQASKILQRSAGAKADGIIGVLTIRACKSIDGGILANLFCENWRNYYKALVKKNPSAYGIYEKGWNNRVDNVIRDNH